MPTTEFIRSEGMGGGVGGMVYSIKDDGNGGDSIISSHANHRGDVIARSNESRSLTSFALYEAYGTRPYEWGDDPDRQKANTKEEEKDLNLLNETMRYRDLETGVFLTRDPLGYEDGPNIYCYVTCNPITKFDPWGLAKTGLDYLDNYDVRVQINDAWEASQGGFFKGSHENGFFMDDKGSVSGAEKMSRPNGGTISSYEAWADGKNENGTTRRYRPGDAFSPLNYGVDPAKATFHTHPDSKKNPGERKPSGFSKWDGTLNDKRFSDKNETPSVVILHDSVCIYNPTTGKLEYINRGDLKPGDLSGSATKYRNYDDMASGDKSKGESMVPETPSPETDSATPDEEEKEKEKEQKEKDEDNNVETGQGS